MPDSPTPSQSPLPTWWPRSSGPPSITERDIDALDAQQETGIALEELAAAGAIGGGAIATRPGALPGAPPLVTGDELFAELVGQTDFNPGAPRRGSRGTVTAPRSEFERLLQRTEFERLLDLKDYNPGSKGPSSRRPKFKRASVATRASALADEALKAVRVFAKSPKVAAAARVLGRVLGPASILTLPGGAGGAGLPPWERTKDRTRLLRPPAKLKPVPLSKLEKIKLDDIESLKRGPVPQWIPTSSPGRRATPPKQQPLPKGPPSRRSASPTPASTSPSGSRSGSSSSPPPRSPGSRPGTTRPPSTTPPWNPFPTPVSLPSPLPQPTSRGVLDVLKTSITRIGPRLVTRDARGIPRVDTSVLPELGQDLLNELRNTPIGDVLPGASGIRLPGGATTTGDILGRLTAPGTRAAPQPAPTRSRTSRTKDPCQKAKDAAKCCESGCGPPRSTSSRTRSSSSRRSRGEKRYTLSELERLRKTFKCK